MNTNKKNEGTIYIKNIKKKIAELVEIIDKFEERTVIMEDIMDINDDDTQKDNINNSDSKKYNVTLEFVNKLLINLNKTPINNLKNFKDIDRDDIISDINKNLVSDFEKHFFPLFDKNKFGWSRRNCTRNYILTFIRYACNEINLDFKSKKKNKTVEINGKNYQKICMTYSITDKTNKSDNSDNIDNSNNSDKTDNSD